MPLNYTTYVAELANLAVYVPGAPEFVGILPGVIDYAEGRIYRELDLLSANFQDYSTTLTAGTRTAALSQSFVVVDSINILTPAGTGATDGTRSPMTAASKEVVNTLWPGSTTQGVPSLFAMVDQWTIVMGPAPDQNYVLEVIGTQHPPALSALNPDTFLTDNLPDLLIAASMVFLSAWKQNFGGAVNSPDQGGSWESMYQMLQKSAMTEELRKYRWAGSWTSYPISPEAQPQRG